jgi:hypothetical protein
MGLTKNPAKRAEKQEGRKPRQRYPRERPCLLKGCERRYHARQARQRYCSGECRAQARQWSRWKAQQTYRATASGKAKRNAQSKRYRQQVRCRKVPPTEALAAREGNPTENFLRLAPATARGATNASGGSGEVLAGASVHRLAVRRWNECGGGSGAGSPDAELRPPY